MLVSLSPEDFPNLGCESLGLRILALSFVHIGECIHAKKRAVGLRAKYTGLTLQDLDQEGLGLRVLTDVAIIPTQFVQAGECVRVFFPEHASPKLVGPLLL